MHCERERESATCWCKWLSKFPSCIWLHTAGNVSYEQFRKINNNIFWLYDSFLSLTRRAPRISISIQFQFLTAHRTHTNTRTHTCRHTHSAHICRDCKQNSAISKCSLGTVCLAWLHSHLAKVTAAWNVLATATAATTTATTTLTAATATLAAAVTTLQGT